MKRTPTELDIKAAKLFRVTRGMTYGRVSMRGEQLRASWCVASGPVDFDDCTDLIIDTDDPATIGAMLAQVVDAWGGSRRRRWVGRMWGGHWTCCVGGVEIHGPTEAAAIVAAMEARPK